MLAWALACSPSEPGAASGERRSGDSGGAERTTGDGPAAGNGEWTAAGVAPSATLRSWPDGLVNEDAIVGLPDGRWILGADRLHLWTPGGEPVELVTDCPPDTSAFAPLWLRGDALFGQSAYCLFRLDTRSGETAWTRRSEAPVAVSPDGSRVVEAYGHTVTLLDGRSGTELTTIEGPEAVLREYDHAVFTPEGASVLFVDGELATRVELAERTATEPQRGEQLVAAGRNGTRLVRTRAGARSWHLSVVLPDGTRWEPLSQEGDLTLSPSGRFLLTVEPRQSRVLIVDLEGERRRLVEWAGVAPAPLSRVAVSDDDSQLLAVFREHPETQSHLATWSLEALMSDGATVRVGGVTP